MNNYRHNTPDTGITAYEAGDDSIIIRFNDGATYLYTAESTGAQAIQQMKMLAKKGIGLTTYINQYVRNNYERKIR